MFDLQLHPLFEDTTQCITSHEMYSLHITQENVISILYLNS
jgi:hypothetical protein